MNPALSPLARRITVPLLVLSMLALAGAPVGADRPAARNTTRTSIQHNGGGSNVNVNRNTNVNVNRNTNVNVNVNNNRGGYYGGGYYNHGPSVGGVIAATVATAIVVGAIVNTLPPNCTTFMANGFTYQNCGGTYYQPQYQGNSVTYVVVNHP
jgi:hypothetical protein